jgi:hypothetical protein
MKGPVLRSIGYVKQSWDFFHILVIVIGWLVPSPGQKIPVQSGWYFPPQKIPLIENTFLQASKGAENTKENPGYAFRLFSESPTILVGSARLQYLKIGPYFYAGYLIFRIQSLNSKFEQWASITLETKVEGIRCTNNTIYICNHM